MRIDRLTLQGFKSFGERTVLDFSPGVFGIVGPNGSGKSNLVEALRWAVGARARELRGEEALSLLFHGADGKAPLGFAEVGLELSNGSGRLSLSRRLDRDGETEVRLGGSRATLRQIESALTGTGLSRTGYAVVGQGEVGQILQAGPEVLLSYLEEAAGLRAVTQASRTAQERLSAASAEFDLRLADAEARKTSLEGKAQQVGAARRAAELAARILVLRRSALAARIQEAGAEAQAARVKSAGLEAERAQIAGRVGQMEAQKSAAVEAVEVAQTAHAESLRRAESLLGESRLAAQEAASYQNLLRRLAQDLADGESRLARLWAVVQPTQPEEAEPDDSTDTEAKLKALEAALRAEEARLREGQGAFERYLQAQAAFEVQQAAYQQWVGELEGLRADKARLGAELSALSSSLQSGETREAELRLQLDALVKQESQFAGDARAANAEAGRLGAMLRSGSDLAEGPRKAREAGIAGIMGIVADLLEVPPHLDLAIETLLAGRMSWVLCETEAAAQAAIEYLKRQGGRATFLPRTSLRVRVLKLGDWPKEAGVLGLARDLVGLPALAEALPTLLGDALVLESLEAALSLRKRAPGAPRMVTREGELLESSGAITGGRVQKGGQMLALRRRLQEASREAERLSADAGEAGERAGRIREELAALDLGAGRRKRDELAAELRALEARLARPAPIQPPPPEPVSAPDPEALESLRAERESQYRQLSGRREIAALWGRYREDSKRHQDAQAQIAELEARALQLRGEQAELADKLGAALGRKTELEAERAGLSLEALEQTLQAARQNTRALSEEESRLMGRTNAILSDLESLLLTQARREATAQTLQAELSELPHGPAEPGSPRGLARALSEAEAALEALGPVNHLAEREYRALEEDVARLEAALAEATEVVGRLGAELRLVQTEYRERLGAKYAVFKDKFAQYAEALLGAEVQLERVPEGLNLVLKPAGKRTVSLDLLSMGERTMGALAFLFALSEIGEGGGLPVAVLDEVDAPLDEANIQRFCRFLRHFAGQTQFILVTHQKRTMEACDALYGVTSERGLSKIFSIKSAGL